MTDFIRRVAEVTTKLAHICQPGMSLTQITAIWAKIPIGDLEDMNDLESVNECILDISNLVDTNFPHLMKPERTAKKYRLMSELFSLKAELLEKY
jgi:hypothetical protein